MRENDITDYHEAARLLVAWEEASLSMDEETRLEDFICSLSEDNELCENFREQYPGIADTLDLYIGLMDAGHDFLTSRALSECDYKQFYDEADECIKRLSVAEKYRKRGNNLRFLATSSVAAACMALFILSIVNYSDINIEEPEFPGNSYSYIPLNPNNSVETALNVDNGNDASADKSDSGNNSETNVSGAASPAPSSLIKRKRSVPSQKKIAEFFPDDDETAYMESWTKFISMRTEMADVVRPVMIGSICSDMMDVVNPDIINDDPITVNVSRSIEDAEIMLNSLFCEL